MTQEDAPAKELIADLTECAKLIVNPVSDQFTILSMARQIARTINRLDSASEVVTPPAPTNGNAKENAVIYGHDGYTDKGDPRTTAMMSHYVSPYTGKLAAVWGGVIVQPGTKYKCVLVDLLPQDQSCNLYVEVYDKSGNAASKNNARQLTGYRESATDYDALYESPQSPGEFFMGHDGKFFKNDSGAMPLGPYGVCIVDDQGKIDSDIAGSFGLPNGQHTSYRIAFKER